MLTFGETTAQNSWKSGNSRPAHRLRLLESIAVAACLGDEAFDISDPRSTRTSLNQPPPKYGQTAKESAMSVRANSLRSVVIDSIYMALVFAAAAATTALVANGAEPQILQIAEGTATPSDDARPSDDHIDSRLNTDDNRPSGDPTESPAAKQEAIMLGMTLFERTEGNIQVKDVAASSPAWDAGIRAGDRIRSLDGVKPKRLTAWINDVGSILKDTTDGHAVSADVEREGETLDLRIKVPVSNADQARAERKAQEEMAREKMRLREVQEMAQGQGQPMAPGGYAAKDRYMDDGIGYGGYGLGGFFDDGAPSTGDNGDDRLATSAVAQLNAVNTLGGEGFGNAQSSGGQVGIAGFQDSGEGVNAVVMVQGLPQGNYSVGIGDGGNMGTGFGNEGRNPAANGTGAGQNQSRNNFDSNNRNLGTRDSASRNPYNPRANQQPNQQQPGFRQQQPGFGQPINPSPNMQQEVTPGAGATPGTGGGSPAGGGAASGAGDGASLANPHAAVLAQQLDPQMQNRGNATQQSNRPGIGAANEVNQQNAAQQRGSRNPYNPDQDARNQHRQQNGGLPADSPLGSPFVAEIGTLQVGPDGVGRVQNRFEGMTVRNLAGMSVIVESNDWQGARGMQNDPRVSQQATAGQSGMPQSQNRQPQTQNGQPSVQANGQTTRGAQGIVASGVIQLRNGSGMTGEMEQQQPQTGLQTDQRSPSPSQNLQRGGLQRPGNSQPRVAPARQ